MSQTLANLIINRQTGILTYGMTPPKLDTPEEKLSTIARTQHERIASLPIDGLILYDVQEEDSREGDRPFPYLEAMDPGYYRNTYLNNLQTPSILYRSAGKYHPGELESWMAAQPEGACAVFVGASSSTQPVKTALPQAFEIGNRYPHLLMGGVMIPERHMNTRDEHLRVIRKMESGCRFFVSQAIYNVEASKDFLSDYYYACQEQELEMVPILFNFAPCGSLKTLEFIKWLGISLPRWLEQDLIHSHDILDKSITLVRKIMDELMDFALEKGIPVGCSVESVSTRKVEIEAALQLLRDIRGDMDKKLGINGM
jgi:hypothetical protein